MTDTMTKAYINMNGVLHAMVYLCDLDKESQTFIKPFDLTIQFCVKSGPVARLNFKNGKCTFMKGKDKADIKLSFRSPEHFNNMLDGKAMPIITKGFTKLSFLTKKFTYLSKRLEYYLKPTDESWKQDDYKEINTILTFYTAFNSLAEIGMHDPVGRKVMQKDRKGLFCASIESTGDIVRLKMGKGSITTIPDSDGSPEMHLVFSDIDKTNDVLNGKSDFLTAIGFGDVKIKGYMPLMQSVELLVPKIAAYLK